MRGKSSSWIVACCILEIIYGLAFMSMAVAGSYLWPQSFSDKGVWLAILYTLTGFCGVMAGQEDDRILPLLHTVMALICIIWTPLMWETLYLLVRPSTSFAYNFLTEMDYDKSQPHWAAYIMSICCVVAGSFLYLLSAALTAYQYGVRIINRKDSRKQQNPSTRNPAPVNTSPRPPKNQTPSPALYAVPAPRSRSLKNPPRSSPLSGQQETAVNGSVNVDVDEGGSIVLGETSYHHHGRTVPVSSNNNNHRSSQHYTNQSQEPSNPAYAHSNRLGTGDHGDRDRRNQTYDRREQTTGNRDGNARSIAFSPYYQDAQEAIV